MFERSAPRAVLVLAVVAYVGGPVALAAGDRQGTDNQQHQAVQKGAPWKDFPGARPHGGFRDRLEKLALTQDQKAALQVIAERFRPRFWEIAQRGAEVRDQLAAVPPDDPGFADAVRQAADASGRIAVDSVELASEMWSEAYAVLTVEQREQLRKDSTVEQERWDEWRRRHQPAEKPAS